MAKRNVSLDLEAHYADVLSHAWRRTPWVLRITDRSDKPSPVCIALQRFPPLNKDDLEGGRIKQGTRPNPLRERGLCYGEHLRVVTPALKRIIMRVCDEAQVPLALEQYLSPQAASFRGNLPLDEEAGCKVALICKLQERLGETERVELMAYRVAKLTAEEAGYWFSRITNFGEAANRWAQAGLKIVLAGQPGDPAVGTMLDQLRGGA
jgi:hypothetical protein